MDAHRYETGEHVSLLLAHPDDYRRRCLEFLERCTQLHGARHSHMQCTHAQAFTGENDIHSSTLTGSTSSLIEGISNVKELAK